MTPFFAKRRMIRHNGNGKIFAIAKFFHQRSDDLSVYVPDCVQLGVYIHLVGCVIAGFYVENHDIVVLQRCYGGIAFCSVSRVAVSCGSFRSDPFRPNTLCHPLQRCHRTYYDRAAELRMSADKRLVCSRCVSAPESDSFGMYV